MADKKRIGSLAYLATWIGLVLGTVGFWLWGVQRVGLLSFVVLWVAWILICVPKPAYMLFVEKDESVRKYEWLIVGSWVLLVGSAVASTIYVVVFPPNWDLWTGIGTDASRSPYMLTICAMLPACFAWWYSRTVEEHNRGYRFPEERLRDYLRRKREVDSESK
jgi:lysylphosphatidylglycerol synthetase-like protein (DUF2156 family)